MKPSEPKDLYEVLHLHSIARELPCDTEYADCTDHYAYANLSGVQSIGIMLHLGHGIWSPCSILLDITFVVKYLLAPDFSYYTHHHFQLPTLLWTLNTPFVTLRPTTDLVNLSVTECQKLMPADLILHCTPHHEDPPGIDHLGRGPSWY